jgi:hypothetical protein
MIASFPSPADMHTEWQFLMHDPAQIADSTIPRPINCIFALKIQIHHSEAAGTARRVLVLFQGHPAPRT